MFSCSNLAVMCQNANPLLTHGWDVLALSEQPVHASPVEWHVIIISRCHERPSSMSRQRTLCISVMLESLALLNAARKLHNKFGRALTLAASAKIASAQACEASLQTRMQKCGLQAERRGAHTELASSCTILLI